MKFARFLEENRVQAWAEHYVDYRLLKKRLKAVRSAAGGAKAASSSWIGRADGCRARPP